MLSSEFLLEALSLTKYKKQAQDAVNQAILDTMTRLVDDLNNKNFDAARNADENNFFKSTRPALTDYLERNLKRNLERNLTATARDMTGTADNLSNRSGAIFVYFDIIDDLGLAHANNTISLSSKEYLEPLVKGLTDQLLDLSLDWYEGDSFLRGMTRLLKSLPNDERLQDILINDLRDSNVITEMVRTFIHECVHVAQHLPQQQKQLDRTQYRSYLQKSKEDFENAYEKQNGKYVNPDLMYRLHASSPQEIGAFTHNLAMEMIDELGWDEYTDNPEYIERVDYIHLLGKVKDHLTNRGIYPKTPAEVKVFRRYLKLVYQEVERYREWLLSKIEKDDTQ
jgi:hypothetical protein